MALATCDLAREIGRDGIAAERKLLLREIGQLGEGLVIIVHFDVHGAAARLEPQAALGPEQEFGLRRRVVRREEHRRLDDVAPGEPGAQRVARRKLEWGVARCRWSRPRSALR